MHRIRIVTGPEECRALWDRLIPQQMVSDLWEVRDCFYRHYRHRHHFVVAEEKGRVCGFLPLSWNREDGAYSYFPGETWQGKTWLEQNRVLADTGQILEDMLATLDRPYHLRYLRSEGAFSASSGQVDEIGYLFIPRRYGYDMNGYFEEFSHKSAKRLKRELAAWQDRTVEWRYDVMGDFDLMIEMNRDRYGESSYFHDQRFLDSFHALMRLLRERGWLRQVTVLIDGEPAAVDMGSVYKNALTLLAGGTNQLFPGVAKLINVQHMNWACEQRLESVDFLCGDFNWKSMFHLMPAPLYMLAGSGRAAERPLWLGCRRSRLTPPELGTRGVGSV